MKLRRRVSEALSALMAVTGAVLVVAALFPVANPIQAELHLRGQTAGDVYVAAIALMIVAGVLLMVGGLKLSKRARGKGP